MSWRDHLHMENNMRTSQLMPRSILPLAAAALLVLNACGGETAKTADSTAAMSAAMTDTSAGTRMADSVASIEVIPPAAAVAEPVAVAPVATPAGVKPKPVPTRPRSSPRPATPVASNSAPARAPAEAGRASGTIAAGTTIGITSGARLCSNTAQVGDGLTATTNSVVTASNGVSLPAGSRVGLIVTKSKTSANQGDEAELAFDVRSVTFGGETYTMSGEVTTSAVLKERKGGDGKKVAIGAAAGAVIGNIIGGGSRVQRTVVGAAAGGAAGAAAAALSGDRLACLPEGSALTVRVGSPVTIRN